MPKSSTTTNIPQSAQNFFPYGTEASLFGGSSPIQGLDHSDDVKQRIKDANKKILRNNIEDTLSRTQGFRSDVRMHVHFGCFILDSVKRLNNGIVGYSHEEFREMLLLDRTRGRLIRKSKLTTNKDHEYLAC